MWPQAVPPANWGQSQTAWRMRSSGTLDQSISTVAKPLADGSVGTAPSPGVNA